MERILRSKTEPIKHGFNSLGQFMWTRLEQLDGQSVCVIDATTDEHLTVSELKSRAKSIAMALIERGINKTDIIAFSGQNSIQHLVLRFATYFMGNTCLPLSSTFGKYEIEREVNNTSANIIFTSAEDLHKFEAILNNNKNLIKVLVVFDGNSDKYLSFEKLLNEERDQTLTRIPYFDINREDIAVLMSTSGTTGTPKLAMISNRCLINITIARNNWYRTPVPIHTNIAIGFPLTHISGITRILPPMINGSTVVIFRQNEMQLILKSIEKYKINLLSIYQNRTLFDEQLAQQTDLSSLKYIFTPDSNLLKNEIIQKNGIKLKNGYSLTEYIQVTKGLEFNEHHIPRCLGQVSPGTEVKIVDLTTGESLGAGIDGEICIRGDKMFSGYFKNDSANEEAFDRDGWFRTGDIGHYDKEERLFITDRIKEIIDVLVDNTFQHISPKEIENFLYNHKSIADVMIVGVRNRTGSQSPRAFVVLKNGHKLKEEDIERYVSDTLPVHKHLTGGVVLVDVIHTLSTGKIDRKYYKNLVKNEIIE